MTFEGVVKAIRADDCGAPGLYVWTDDGKDRIRYSQLDIGDAAVSEFHVGQKVKVTVEAVEESANPAK